MKNIYYYNSDTTIEDVCIKCIIVKYHYFCVRNFPCGQFSSGLFSCAHLANGSPHQIFEKKKIYFNKAKLESIITFQSFVK